MSESSVEHRDSTKGSSSSGVSSDLSDSDHEIDDHSKVFDFHIEASTQTTTFEEPMINQSYEELDDLRIECKQLVTRKHSLESELETYKGEITVLRRQLEEGEGETSQKMTALERVEYSLRNQLKEWEKKYENLKKDHQALLEEKCELEEAENDSRLNAQRWEQQHVNTVEKSQLLNEELSLERKSNDMLRSQIDSVSANLEEARNEVAYLESLVQRYEQRVFDLEELEVELREKLALLEGAIQFALWWNKLIFNQTTLHLPSRPMIVNYASEIEPPSASILIEDWPALVQSLKQEKQQLAASLNAMMAEKESLAISLEGNHEDKIDRIVKLEDRIAELLNNAATHKELCSKEIKELKLRIKSMESKQPAAEDAFRETIAEADSLLSKMETEHQETIKCLQDEKRILEEQVRLLEQSQGYLKNQLAKLTDDTQHKDEIADLAERLLAAERRELDVKEKLHNLQKVEKEMELQLQEQKRINEDLKQELKDQDEIIQTSVQYKQESIKLSMDNTRLRETESFLSGRVEELEQEANTLKANLTSVDKKIWDRERKWQEKLDNLEDELASCSGVTSEDAKMQHSLKIEVEGLKCKSSELQSALDEKCQEVEKSEAAFRSEVSLAVSGGSAPTLSTSKQHKMGLVRYRSLRDHNGRYYLVVKIH